MYVHIYILIYTFHGITKSTRRIMFKIQRSLYYEKILRLFTWVGNQQESKQEFQLADEEFYSSTVEWTGWTVKLKIHLKHCTPFINLVSTDITIVQLHNSNTRKTATHSTGHSSRPYITTRDNSPSTQVLSEVYLGLCISLSCSISSCCW